MEKSNAFYKLKPEDSLPLGLLCVTITEGIMKKNENTRLQGDMMEAFQRLQEKLIKINENNQMDIELDVKETFALFHALVQTSYGIKGQIMLPDDKKLDPEAEAEFNEIFELMKEKATDLIWLFTKCFDYCDYGLDTLENIYDIKTGVVRKLKVDNVDELSTLILTEPAERALQWAFKIIDTMRVFQEDSEVARRLYNHEFMNMTDFKEVSPKFMLAKTGDKISLTRRDCIILYWVTAFSQRIYVTDIADVLRDISKGMPDADFALIRKFMLHFYGILIRDMEKSSANDAELLAYYHKVNDWVM